MAAVTEFIAARRVAERSASEGEERQEGFEGVLFC